MRTEDVRTEQNILRLSLKKQWFDMTKAGIKTEDYREITPYWIKRLFDDAYSGSENFMNDYMANELNNGRCLEDVERDYLLFRKKFTQNTMTLGYPKSTDNERILKLEHKGIEIRTGNPEWGAEPGELYFVIKHGNIIK